MSDDVIRLLEERRAGEKEQALLYRALSAAAEESGEAALAERLHELHADEQHHLSRLTARLVELGARPADLDRIHTPEASLPEWEPLARSREREEVAAYETMLGWEMDAQTRELLQAILEVERRHAEELGGKWTLA